MRSVNNSSKKIDALRKRNKITITILTSFIISLTLIIGALITHLLQQEKDTVPFSNYNPVLFYTAPCHAPPCWRVYNTIITATYITDPANILSLTLQTSIEHLENLVSLIQMLDEPQHMKSRANRTVVALINCSDSVRSGSGQIKPLLRVSPYAFETQSGEMIKRIISAEENLVACVRDLGKAEESTAVIEVREKVLRVKEYLSSSRNNLFAYYERDVVWDKFWGEFVAKWGVMCRGVFLICVGGLQLVFMFFLFWTLFKFRCR